jgi:hypothetical protein
VIGVTSNSKSTSYNVGMILSRAIKGFLAGLMTVAVLTIAPSGLTPPAHAEMNHGGFNQGCLAGCMNGNPSQPGIASTQNPEEEQNRKPAQQPEPYYLQFVQLQPPQKLVSQTKEAAYILRPPDLVKLYSTYRN